MAYISQYTDEQKEYYVDLMCAAISTSNRGLARLAEAFKKEDERFPAHTTILLWMAQSKDYTERYARARETQADYLADEIIEISDNDTLDLAFNDEGKAFVDHENIQRSRLRVDARKWVAAKLKPQRYGDKVDHTVANPDGTPLDLVINFVSPHG